MFLSLRPLTKTVSYFLFLSFAGCSIVTLYLVLRIIFYSDRIFSMNRGMDIQHEQFQLIFFSNRRQKTSIMTLWVTFIAYWYIALAQ
jgi:hypothetical protein